MRIRRKTENQKIKDRARKARKERIFGDRNRERYERYGFPSGDASNQVGDQGGKGMVKLTRLNGEVLYLNLLQIQSMESIPETKVRMMNGDYYLVKDTEESIMDQIRAFIKSCIVYEGMSK